MNRPCTSAVLIGFGSIGHFHARLLNDRYNRLAIVDMDNQARIQASDLYPKAVISPLLEELESFDWDWSKTLAVIATWGPNHATLFDELVSYGVKYILCEKPLAGSIKSGAAMVRTARKKNISLGVHHHLRYSGFSKGVRNLASQHGLGEPVAILLHGGANGILTRGIHYLDASCDLFGRYPLSVISSAWGDPINPRSQDLMFYDGTVSWNFGQRRELCFFFSNHSSITRSFNIYFRNASLIVLNNFEVEIRSRKPSDVKKFPTITRTGELTEILYRGPIPGFLPKETRTLDLLDDIESGNVNKFPPTLALLALNSCIGALEAGRSGRRVDLPIDVNSAMAAVEWPIS